jgi:molecular chaperone DnaK (HSP70)
VVLVDNVKRLMGKAFDESLARQCGYEIVATSDGRLGIRCGPEGRTLSPQEVAAEILKVLSDPPHRWYACL